MSENNSTQYRNGRKPFTDAERESAFWSRVDRRGAGECWPWIPGAARHRQGYGMSWTPGVGPNGRGQMLLAHRIAYAYTSGACPPDLDVLHSCDNPPCCNPEHLRLGTQADNMRDAVERGRHRNPNVGIRGEDNPAARLTNADVIAIRRAVAVGSRGTQRRLAAQLGVTPSCVNDIVCRRTWAHLPEASS